MALDFKRNAASDIHTTFITKASIVLFCFFLIILVTFLIIPERKAAANDISTGTYRIISIEVEEGDSLWNIAKEYYTDDFDNNTAYFIGKANIL